MKSTASSSEETDIPEEREYTVDNKKLCNWKLPKIPATDIYEGNRFLAGFKVRTSEETIVIDGENMTILLFKEEVIKRHLEDI